MTDAPPAAPVRDGTRNGSAAATTLPAPTRLAGAPHCPVCERPLPSARARYCSPVCRQRAFRLRHPSAPSARAVDPAALATALRRRRALSAHTVYECPQCNERRLGEHRCPECHLFCRALGLGGTCPDCDAVLLLEELLGKEVLG